MQFLVRLVTLLAVAVPFAAQAAPVASSKFSVIPGKYIIQLNPDVNLESITAHHALVREIHARNALTRRGVSKDELAGIQHEYSIGDFHGYSGGFDTATIEELKKMPEVLNVEEDKVMWTSDLKTEANSPWGLGTISSKSGTAGSYIYDSSSGTGMYNYIVDTGIRLTHTEFAGRAIWGYNAVNTQNTDNAGHGTHVSGIIGGSTYGVAKNATLVAVKVFEGNSGDTSTVIKGFEWAVNDVVNNSRTDAAVINMSLGGEGSSTWDAAISAAWAQGVLAVVASGNENVDASTRSPARSPETITVGNVKEDLARYGGSSGSNYGDAVDIMAPGTNILSSYKTSDTATVKMTGTSMASPHVAGLVSYIRGLEGKMSAEKVKARILGLATTGKVTDLMGSADRLAYNGNGR